MICAAQGYSTRSSALSVPRLDETLAFALRIVVWPMPAVEYRYELGRGDEVVATGHLSRERPLEVGGRVEIVGPRRDRARRRADPA